MNPFPPAASNSDPDDDPRLLAAAREYLAVLEAGGHPDRQAYRDRLPELADLLDEYLDGVELAFSLGPRPAPVALPETSGQPLGDFQILREIARGGMGTVYEARQLSLGRPVALKVLPFAASLDSRKLKRFQLEAQAAAQLHHSNIVPVHAVGSDRGVHYYAMQLIQGRSVSDLLNAALPGPGTAETAINWSAGTNPPVGKVTASRSLGQTAQDQFRTVARLIAQVADALDYAHGEGVIHRDIKPGNLLLDAQGHIWITDFGLAQIRTGGQVTLTGELLGTLRYMSPEQASGRRTVIDHRSDIYSLGATLYEMLTRQPMFAGQDHAVLLRQILQEEPRPLRELDPLIPVELETIVLKSVAKSPEERYQSATELAADLRRYLEERPILARRPTLLDRGRKWLRRHPGVVGTALLILMLGVIGLTAAVAAVNSQKQLTQQALEGEQDRAREAKEQFRLAQQAVNEMISIAEVELSNDPVQESLRQRLLESAASYYQRFIEERAEGEDVARLAETRDQVQRILADLAILQADRDTMLLRDGAVRGDLQLTEDQETEALELLQEYDERRRTVFQQPGNGPPLELLTLVSEKHQRLAEILTTAQRKRLHQISLQRQIPMIFRNSEVIRALDLTARQRQQIRQLEMRMFFARREHHHQPGHVPFPGTPGQPKPPVQAFPPQPPENHPPGPKRVPGPPPPAATLEEILKILTPDQQARWQELIGEPFRSTQPAPWERPLP